MSLINFQHSGSMIRAIIINFVIHIKYFIMKRLYFIFLILAILTLTGVRVHSQTADLIIPVPREIKLSDGFYTFTDSPEIKTVRLKEGKVPAEGYILEISPKRVTIKASDDAGEFYAHQTLRQMSRNGQVKSLQCCTIADSPRFGYRGLHFDVSRHFRSLDFLKKQVDAMAMYKMNRMHLHLTDAAGWRIRIDAYPRLTEFAAWRPQVTWKEWWNGGRAYAEEGTPGIYGGYYTKDEMRELVEYARERHIEVLPEIEMPSHSEEVFAAYPELGCSNEPYKDCDFCVGNEKTFEFLETVLSEVMEIFPYEYIHIGGDEAGKGRWKTCPQCQQRMKEEGLKDVDELQSYLIRRIEKFVNSKGRKIIGWDEILEGGLAPDATVMSWRGTEGGIEAMRQGHDVIMSPGKYCYLDHAQDAPFKEPESIGGYLPLENVYGYEPVEASMPSESLHHLIGVQANLWTEYITADEHAEYMYWPRALAIAETGWSRPEAKDYADFKGRVMTALDMLRSMGYSTFDLENEYGERKLAQTGVAHKAVGAAVTYNIPINKSYPGAGETTLTDGVIGGWTYSDGRWQGFLSDIDVTLDLGEVMPVHYVGGSFMQLTGPYVFMPKKVVIYVSEDGENFTRIAEVWNDVSQRTEELVFRNFDTICDVKARYVRYKAETSGVHGGWIFLDEIIVN